MSTFDILLIVAVAVGSFAGSFLSRTLRDRGAL